MAAPTTSSTNPQPMKPASQFLMYMNTAFFLVIPVVVLLLLGIWMDKLFHTTPYLSLIGAVLGFSGSIFTVYRTVINRL